jgi:hypothetical protein
MSAIAGLSSSNPTSATDAYRGLSTEDFYELIFTELTNQDPLAPSETKDLMEQISTIQAIQSDQQLTERLEDMVRQNEVTTSSSLVGKFVSGRSRAGLDVAGFVDSVSITREGPVLNLSSGNAVAMDDLLEVIDPALLDGTGGNEPPVVANVIPDQLAERGVEFSFTIPRDTFSDEEDLESLTFVATQDDGSPLPEWLELNAATRTLTGTPPLDAASPLRVRVTAIDSFNQRVSDTFTITLTEGP